MKKAKSYANLEKVLSVLGFLFGINSIWNWIKTIKEKLTQYFVGCGNAQQATSVTYRIRSRSPRRIQNGGRHNLTRYPSKKARFAVEPESYRVEMAAFYILEFNSDVLEYYNLASVERIANDQEPLELLEELKRETSVWQSHEISYRVVTEKVGYYSKLKSILIKLRDVLVSYRWLSR